MSASGRRSDGRARDPRPGTGRRQPACASRAREGQAGVGQAARLGAGAAAGTGGAGGGVSVHPDRQALHRRPDRRGRARLGPALHRRPDRGRYLPHGDLARCAGERSQGPVPHHPRSRTRLAAAQLALERARHPRGDRAAWAADAPARTAARRSRRAAAARFRHPRRQAGHREPRHRQGRGDRPGRAGRCARQGRYPRGPRAGGRARAAGRAGPDRGADRRRAGWRPLRSRSRLPRPRRRGAGGPSRLCQWL